MAKKRTRKQKMKASVKLVNSQFVFDSDFKSPIIKKEEKAISLTKTGQLASIKNDLRRSMIIAFLILISLMVLYWFS